MAATTGLARQSVLMTDRSAPPFLVERGARELGARELAGYRVLRSLSRDQHAEVLLGHRITDDVARAVAIMALPVSDAAWKSALRVCAALERARGEHVVKLVDVDADDESIRLIFERLPRGDLAELLRVRRALDAGEAVTVLAPITTTLLRMHQCGVAHGNLGAGAVLFRDDGSPTLVGFSRAELFEPGAPEVVLEQIDAVCRDRSAARALALEVLGRVEGARAHAARELAADIDGCDDEVVLPLLASRLFEVAAALPVRFVADEPEDEIAPSSWRPIPTGAAADEPTRDVGQETSTGWAAALGRVVPEVMVERVLDTAGRSPVAPVVAAGLSAVRSRWASWTPRRRRVVLAVGAAAATIGIVTAVVPPGAVATESARTAAAAAGSPSAGPSPSGADGDKARSDETQVDVPAPGSAASDDPVAATGALLRARDRCLSSLSLRCLDQVDEAGSSALHDDQTAVRVAQQGGELPDPLPGATGDGPPALIERLGDSALVRLGGAASGASLLLVKVDGVWRIRDVIDAGATPTAEPSAEPTA